MKKILLILLFVIVIAVSGCVPTDTLNEYNREVNELESIIQELEEEIDSLEITVEELQSELDDISAVIDLDVCEAP